MKRTFTTIVCALLLVAMLAGCGSTGSTNPFDAKAKTFDAEGMQITLTTDFSQESLEGYTVGYAAKTAIVLALHETKAEFAEAGVEDVTFEQYVEFVRQANSDKAIVDGEPWLFLEDEDGAIKRERGADLAQRISELAVTPRLVLLASCESAGSGGLAADGSPLAALGPRLARAGVPAVIAMQGQVSLATAAAFTGAFFRQLQKDGQDYGDPFQLTAVDGWTKEIVVPAGVGQIS